MPSFATGLAAEPGIRRTAAHPIFQERNFLRPQLPLLRHHQFLIALANCLNEQTFLGMSRHNRRPGIAAFEQRRPAIEQQAPFMLFRLGRVAFMAMLHEKRTDFGFEEIDVGRGRLRGNGARSKRDGQKNDKSTKHGTALQRKSGQVETPRT